MSGAQTPLRNPRLEKVAQELAKFKSAVEASQSAGYPPGTSFDSNARKRAQRPEVQARVAFLQGKAAELVVYDVAYIKRKLGEIIDHEVDSEEIDFSIQLRAMDMMLKIEGGYAPEKHDVRAAVASMNVNSDGETTDEARKRALQAFFAKLKAKSEAA